MAKDQLIGERYCLNCKELLPEEALYCHLCSQKTTDGRITVKELLREFFDSVFNIDSKFFRTIGSLAIPGKLTIQYFLGRHKTYTHPIRLFLVSGILFFSLISIVTFSYQERQLDKAEDSMLRFSAHRSQVIQEIDTFKAAVLDSFQHKKLVVEAFDSLDAKIDKWRQNDSMSLGYFEYYPPFTFKQIDLTINKVDAFEMSGDELAKAYNFNKNFVGQVIVTQAIKAQTKLNELISSVISQSIWSFLFMMLALGLILKLLYIRRKVYYIEHLIFSFHFHSFIFILGSLLLLIGWISPSFLTTFVINGQVDAILFVVVLIYMFIAMKRVYQQKWFKTFMKFCILNFCYLIIFTLFISISAVITFLVF